MRIFLCSVPFPLPTSQEMHNFFMVGFSDKLFVFKPIFGIPDLLILVNPFMTHGDPYSSDIHCIFLHVYHIRV